jgi:uncharacterized protein (DUF486 family)
VGARGQRSPPLSGTVAPGPARLFAMQAIFDALSRLPLALQAGGLLVLSNLFMTMAWYGHLKNMADRPWWWAAIASWGIALFEYLLQVPANRIGAQHLSVGQLKVMQEVISLSVFVPFAVMYLGQPLKWDYLWAGLCLIGAAYFLFRG